MSEGYIAIHRKILDNPIFDNPHLLKMWMWCLLKATHTEHEQLVGLQKILLKKGQFITGRFAGAQELKVNPNTWYKHMNALQSMGMIAINSNNKFTVVTVVKWELYQTDQPKNNNKITTKEQQNNTNNNVNNDNNKYSAFTDEFSKEIVSLYRGRKSKSTRDKKLPKILKEYTQEEILKSIKNYNSTLKQGQKDYILNEGTFWNGRYIDYLDENFKENKNNKAIKPTDGKLSQKEKPKFVYRDL